MHAIARALMFLLAAIIAVPAAAHQSTTVQPPQDCDNAPADAILQLPAPVGYWIRIVCTATGHALAPASGDAWEVHQDARWSGIPAGFGAAGGPNELYFVKAAVHEITGTDQSWAGQLFAQRAGFAVPDSARKIYALDLTDNRGKQGRVYIFTGDDGPVAGVACLSTCEETVTVTVTHPEAAPME